MVALSALRRTVLSAGQRRRPRPADDVASEARQARPVEIGQLVLAHDLAHELHVVLAELGIAQERADQIVAVEIFAALAQRRPRGAETGIGGTRIAGCDT